MQDIENYIKATMSNEDYSKESDILAGTLMTLRVLKPLLYMKIIHTGRLFEKLGYSLQESIPIMETFENENVSIPQHYTLAAYYCNFGYLSIEDAIYKNNYTSDNDLQIIRRHTEISSDLLNEKGFRCVAQIIKKHHEKPNGTGYMKQQNVSDKLIGLLNIADGFIEAVMPSKKPEPVLVFDEAITLALNGYNTCLLFSTEELSSIRSSISEYYKCSLRP